MRLNLKLIGGSDVAALINVSPWATAHDVFARIVHGRDFEPSEAMLWGTRLEDAIAQAAIESHFSGSKWINGESTEVGGRFRVTPDYIDDAKRVLEVKNVGDRSRWETVPPHYLLQVQWYLHHLDRDAGFIAALHGGSRLELYDVPRDKVLGQRLETIANAFWERHIAREVPPPVDASSACRENLARAWAPSKSMRAASETEEQLVIELARIREQLHELENKKNSVSNQLVSLVGTDYGLTLSDGRRAIAPSVRGRKTTDWTKVVADLAPYLEVHGYNLESVIAQHTKEGAPTRQVKIYDK